MLGSSILDVAVGLVFVYLFLSLISSVVTEWISRLMSLRAVTLESGIRKLLNDPDGNGLTQKFYDHPLIKGITRDGHKPSYIPSRLFALALIDIIAPADTADKNTPANPGNKAGALDKLKEGLNRDDMPDELKKIILPLINLTESDIQKVRQNLEHWFDEGMDRVSGWYKNRTQYHGIVIAVFVTLILNADTLAISKALYKDNTLRNSLVTASQAAVKSETDNTAAALEKINANIANIQLPLGWPDTILCSANDCKLSWHGLFLILSKFLGWTITAIAVSLGAPFWFDMLNKLVNIRSVGKQPAKTEITNSPADASLPGTGVVDKDKING